MGRATKLKKQRKIEKIEKENEKNEKRKLYFTTIISFAVIVVAGFWLNSWYQNKVINEEKNMNYEVVMHTSKGDVKVALDSKAAPKTVENFVTHSRNGYYDGTLFHRVISGFMIQGGDPLSKDDDPSNDGTGGESAWGEKFDDEINPTALGLSSDEIINLENSGYVYNYDLPSLTVSNGVIAMANSGPNTNGSQFFIVTGGEQTHLNGLHTVFGKVIEGMDVVKAIEAVEKGDVDRPVENVVIESMEVIEISSSDVENDLSIPAESDLTDLPEFSIGDFKIETEGENPDVDVEVIE